jgi:hypothetical protein
MDIGICMIVRDDASIENIVKKIVGKSGIGKESPNDSHRDKKREDRTLVPFDDAV